MIKKGDTVLCTRCVNVPEKGCIACVLGIGPIEMHVLHDPLHANITGSCAAIGVTLADLRPLTPTEQLEYLL